MTWTELHEVLHRRGLLVAAPGANPAAAVTVTGIAHDSRRVEPGHVFVALRGQHADGAQFVTEARQRGAVAIVSQEAPAPADAAGWAQVSDARLALACLAAAFHGQPSEKMQVVGITGTNGKTTTAYLVSSIFEAAGVKCGLLGTVAYRVGAETREATRTTPEAPDVQALLAEMVDRGCGACVMEVSSHALALRRVDGIRFAAAVFTNLTRDHLDFHADMEDYFQAKRRLFTLLPREQPAVINADDPRAAALMDTAGRSLTYGINRPADVSPAPLSYSLDGLSFEVRTPRGTIGLRSSLVGRPNVYNILAAVATGIALDIPTGSIEKGIAALDAVPGRFQVVSGPGDDVTVVVDYAHTDDALRNLLETARPLARGRIITVFGCGGDRDRTKRPLMGAVAGRLSDVILITSDNPRSEDPARIIEEIQRGITPDTRRATGQRIAAIVDRQQAIDEAVDEAQAGDLVLVAGKGHEKYQVIGSQTVPFDDVEIAKSALARRRSRQGVK
ncbi:MAG TPA: UDP-N-acetylmuramoyl-L-alanyl-D-glutamate--2,6-diaminopimelate ligase [Vicinamibacterales bacterium]|nr:UDP-N-acetylmuramoyl-L-alanyl-D-glutamate--2,6-diaminopimelate ligase [Vicinamibacterales bacterium]